MAKSEVLVTGGAGFIGSHTCVELASADYGVVVVDDLSNSSPVSIERVEQLTGTRIRLYVADLADGDRLDTIFRRHRFDAVVHLAAQKAVAESVRRPYDYYRTNLGTTLAILGAMERWGVGRVVFSSSCSIYGDGALGAMDEASPARPTNPYARSKLMCEQLLADVGQRHDDWSVTSLRYFNPVGAHPSGLLGEVPVGVPENLMPYVADVAAGRRPVVKVFGGDYPTKDGTCVRDYVHVMDIAAGHRRALEGREREGVHGYNLGTGSGTSVLELIEAFAAVAERAVPYEVVERRPGDVASLVADARLASTELGWKTDCSLVDMCADAWRFQSKNPDGYPPAPERRRPL